MTKELKTASVLAFDRKLSPSDALMYAGKWDGNEWQPIKLQSKAVRGTISNRLKTQTANDPAKLDAEIQKANLQTIDIAALPMNCDTLKITFSLRILGDVSTPCVCNNPVYQNALNEKIQEYINEYEFKELAERYAENIANGRFLWRNRIGAEKIEIKVKDKSSNAFQFNAEDYCLRSFSEDKSDSLKQLADIVRLGLMSETYAYLEVEAYVHLGAGQEVFPSQELVLDNSGKKILYHVNDIAAIHSQKIGNALRTIDTWYPNAYEFGAIAVEPYGSVTSRGAAYRQPKEKMDFYNLLDAWILKDKKPEVEQQHYVVACLIRGGVFGESGKE